jgi:ABC-2 type transport system permease protein
MKNKFWILIKNQLISQSGLNDLVYEATHAKRRRTIIFLILMLFVSLMFAGYSYYFAKKFCELGLGQVVPATAFAITSLGILLYALFQSSDTIFSFKDRDQLMSLPLKTTTIIASKFGSVYGQNLIFALIIMLPMGITFAVMTKISWLFYPIWLCLMLITPIVPIMLAAILGTAVKMVAIHLKYTKLINTILSFGLIIGVMYFCYFNNTTNLSQMQSQKIISISSILVAKINQFYPLTVLANQAAVKFDVWSLLLLALVSLAMFYVFTKLVALKYQTISSLLISSSGNSKYSISKLSTSPPLKSLYKKELKRFFSSTTYLINMSTGIILLLVAAIACYFSGLDTILKTLQLPAIPSQFMLVLPFAIGIILAMSCTAAVSLSLEGKNLWIIQSLPLKPTTIYKSKMLVNLTLLLPVSLISSLLFCLSLRVNFELNFWIFVIPLIYCFFTPVFSMFVNIKLPNFNWQSEVTVIKQGMSSMIGIFGGMLAGLIPIIVMFTFPGWNQHLIVLLSAITLVISTAILYSLIQRSPLPSDD